MGFAVSAGKASKAHSVPFYPLLRPGMESCCVFRVWGDDGGSCLTAETWLPGINLPHFFASESTVSRVDLLLF